MAAENWIEVATTADVPAGGNRSYSVSGQEILIVRTTTGTYAIENMCSHQLQKLEGGKTKGVHIFCPAHGVRFDMRTGCPAGTLTKKPVKVWPAKIEGEAILVNLHHQE
jgi:3-phenylpropionate/trans-cinnamate dioxygenase ferredoxin subunit